MSSLRDGWNARPLLARSGLALALLLGVVVGVVLGRISRAPGDMAVEDACDKTTDVTRADVEQALVPDPDPASFAADQEAETLINSLPRPDRGEVDMVPQHVRKAENQLLRLGLKAFPALLRHEDDRRYCYTTVAGGSAPPGTGLRRTVADLCKEVVEYQVMATYDVKGREGPDGQWHDLRPYLWNRDIGRWWAQRRTRSLRELREEVATFYIEREKGIGSADPAIRAAYLDPLLQLERELKELGNEPRIQWYTTTGIPPHISKVPE